MFSPELRRRPKEAKTRSPHGSQRLIDQNPTKKMKNILYKSRFNFKNIYFNLKFKNV